MKTFLWSMPVKIEWNFFLFRSAVSGEKYIYFLSMYMYIHVFILYCEEAKSFPVS